MTLPSVNQDPNWGAQLNAHINSVETAGLLAAATAQATANAALVKAQNLADLTSVSSARTNLGLAGAALLAVGTTAGTVAAGDDSRIVGAVQDTRQILAGTGLTGGGTLAADRTLTVAYGTSGTTAAVGNDARLSDTRTPTDNSVTSAKIVDGAILNADINASAAIALSKLATDPLARANHTGTQTASTISDFNTAVATTAALKANNLSDVTAATARTNLSVPATSRLISAGTGLTGGGDLSADRTLTVAYGTSSTTATVGNDTRVVNAVQTTGGSTIQPTATNVVPLILKYILSQSVNLWEWTTQGGTVLAFMNTGGNIVHRTGLFQNGTFQVGGETSTAADGVGVMGLTNATTVPTTNPTGGGILYAQAGALKWRGSSGTVTNIANA